MGTHKGKRHVIRSKAIRKVYPGYPGMWHMDMAWFVYDKHEGRAITTPGGHKRDAVRLSKKLNK